MTADVPDQNREATIGQRHGIEKIAAQLHA